MKTVKYEHFISQNTAPYGATKIGLYSFKGKRIGSFHLQKLRNPRLGEKLYSCGVLSDIHFQYNTAQADFEKALAYLNDEELVDSIFICGDLTSSGTDEELQAYKDCIDEHSPNVPVYAISGNHECRTENVETRISTYTGQPLYYSVTKGNDVFIMLGIVSETHGSIFAEGELQWFYETLEANRYKRCFVFQHVRPQDGCGNALGLYTYDIWGGTETTVFESLLRHYKNVILFHGHSHLKFAMQEYDDTANYGNLFGCHSVHIPSLSVPAYNSGSLVEPLYSYYYAGSEGYVMDVYKNHIVLRGRDFVAEKFLPIATYCIDTTPVEIEAKTFIDTTGTITTSY